MRKVVVAMIVFLCIAAIFCGCSREFCEVSYISEGKEFFKTRVEKGGALPRKRRTGKTNTSLRVGAIKKTAKCSI